MEYEHRAANFTILFKSISFVALFPSSIQPRSVGVEHERGQLSLPSSIAVRFQPHLLYSPSSPSITIILAKSQSLPPKFNEPAARPALFFPTPLCFKPIYLHMEQQTTKSITLWEKNISEAHVIYTQVVKLYVDAGL